MMKLDKISWQYYKSIEVVLDNISNINYARARLITSIFARARIIMKKLRHSLGL